MKASAPGRQYVESRLPHCPQGSAPRAFTRGRARAGAPARAAAHLRVQLVPGNRGDHERARWVGIFNCAEASSGSSKLRLGAMKPLFIMRVE